MMRIVVFLLAAFLAGSAVAGDRRVGPGWQERSGTREPTHRRGDLSLGEAVRRARRNSNGRVLSAETVERRGRREYRIKLLTPKGRVRTIRIDPRSEHRR